MGLMDLILWPVTLPVRSCGWLLETIQNEAKRRYYDLEAIEGEMRTVEQQCAKGDINEEEAALLQDELITRFLEAKEYHAEKAQENGQNDSDYG